MKLLNTTITIHIYYLVILLLLLNFSFTDGGTSVTILGSYSQV